LKKSIIEAVKQVDPDILIGVSRFNANYISSIKCRAKKIIECHESKYNTIYDTNFNRSFFAKYFIKIYTSLYFHTIIQNADVIVTLTEGDKMLWKRAKYIDVIPNFSTMSISKYSNCTTKRVIAVGRLQWEKGFDRLLDIWKVVVSKHPDWQLEIFGEGELKEELDNMITKANINNIKLNGIAHDISKEYASSSICTVTSYFEGFSLVLLEAMKHGVPCVAFDCPFGPRNIINDASNGFLVNDGDTKLFAERLCRLIEDEELRKQFSKAAIERSLLFDPDSIMNKWKNLFEQLNSGA
jgi:glycosyltransferase involved in cell wall biosynthesis